MGPRHLVDTFGVLSVIAVVFVESGLPIGFFLPGKSLLLLAGLLAAQGRFDLAFLLVGAFVAAVAGAQIGYVIGCRLGPGVWSGPAFTGRRRAHLERARALFERRGSLTVILSRFLPVVRTFAPIVAGVAAMPLRSFLVSNVIGALLYTSVLLLVGYFVGESAPGVNRYLIPAVAILTVVIAVPALRVRKAAPASATD